MIVPAFGTILGGKWQLERLAGTGGMGEVFQGRDLSSGQQVAVKVLRLSQLDQLVRFEREARTLYGPGFDATAIARRYGAQIGYWSFYLKTGVARLGARA